MKPVWITDATVITPLGFGVEDSWRRLQEGASAIRPVTHFDTGDYVSGVAACIDGLSAEGKRSRFNVLLDLILDSTCAVPKDAALMTASTKGGIDALEDALRKKTQCKKGLSPTELPGYVGKRLGLTDDGFNVNAACASSTIALGYAAGMISAGDAECALVLSLDIVSEFVFSGFSALKALSPGPSRPFDRDRSGLSLGEGAASLLLMHPDRAIREGKRPLGSILGWGVASDAFHITAPALDGSGLAEAIRRALGKARITDRQVCAVSAHGTGTVFNDAMELSAFDTVFGRRPLPTGSIKGAIGHTLGVAGGIETALALRALSEQCLPPTAGLINAEEGAGDRVSDCPQAFSGDILLSTNSGFGGINCALVLGKAVTA
jgi:3-oxoacyl-[acyl-carrier-protein] synthase II